MPVMCFKLGEGYVAKEMAKLVFAILLKDNCMIVNVRSGLVIHNKMELPVEMQLKNEQNGSGKRSNIAYCYLLSIFIELNLFLPQAILLLIWDNHYLPMQYKEIPLHLNEWDIHVRPCIQSPIQCQHSQQPALEE